MDNVEQFITSLILKAIHKSAPAMQPDDDAKVSKAVQDFVTVAMDLVAVFFAIRAAHAAPATSTPAK